MGSRGTAHTEGYVSAVSRAGSENNYLKLDFEARVATIEGLLWRSRTGHQWRRFHQRILCRSRRHCSGSTARAAGGGGLIDGRLDLTPAAGIRDAYQVERYVLYVLLTVLSVCETDW